MYAALMLLRFETIRYNLLLLCRSVECWNETVSQLKTGVVQSDCSGSMVVPTDGGLVKGQAYYARVFAYSPVGFSQGQVRFKVLSFQVTERTPLYTGLYQFGSMPPTRQRFCGLGQCWILNIHE